MIYLSLLDALIWTKLCALSLSFWLRFMIAIIYMQIYVFANLTSFYKECEAASGNIIIWFASSVESLLSKHEMIRGSLREKRIPEFDGLS